MLHPCSEPAREGCPPPARCAADRRCAPGQFGWKKRLPARLSGWSGYRLESGRDPRVKRIEQVAIEEAGPAWSYGERGAARMKLTNVAPALLRAYP